MHNLPNKLGRTWIRRDSKKTKFTKSCKEQEIVENSDRPHSGETQYIEKEQAFVNGWQNWD